MDTATKIFLQAGIAIVMLGAFVGYNQKKVRDLNSQQKPFSSKVLSEKKFCPKNRSCFQELIVSINGKSETLYLNKEPFYSVGDFAKVIKVFSPPLGAPICSKGSAHCSGVDLRKSYKLYPKE